MKYTFFSIASDRDKISKSFRKESCILRTIGGALESFSLVAISKVRLNSQSKGVDFTLFFSIV